MILEELKANIEKQTGVPACLLTGETAEENIAQAKALLAYKREAEAQKPKTTKEQFAEWMNARTGASLPDRPAAALAQIEEQARLEAGGYPILKDGGSAGLNLGEYGSTKKQFAEWAENITAFDPRKTADTWKPLY